MVVFMQGASYDERACGDKPDHYFRRIPCKSQLELLYARST